MLEMVVMKWIHLFVMTGSVCYFVRSLKIDLIGRVEADIGNGVG